MGPDVENYGEVKQSAKVSRVGVDSLVRLPVGTRIRFTRTLEMGPTEDSPACLFANKDEKGEVTGHGCWEGHYVKRDAWPTPFGAQLGKDFVAI